jgi:hypothetical protein
MEVSSIALTARRALPAPAEAQERWPKEFTRLGYVSRSSFGSAVNADASAPRFG